MPALGRDPKRTWVWVAVVIGIFGFYFALRWLLNVLYGYSPVDLEVYRFGVQTWWHGGRVYQELSPTTDGGDMAFIYPPFALLALSPLAMMSLSTANTVLAVVGFCGLATALYISARNLWPASGMPGASAIAIVALPLTVFLEPVWQTFLYGQVSILLMAVVMVDCLAPKTWWPRGLGIGLVAAIKLVPLAFILYFLIRKDFRAAATAGVTAVLATLLGFVIDSKDSIEYWFTYHANPWSVGGSAFKTNQTVEAVITRIGLSAGVAQVTWILLLIGLLWLTTIAMRRATPLLALLLNANLALLASPTSWSHYWVWVVPALLTMIGMAILRWQERSVSFAGWTTAILLTASVFYLAPFQTLPITDFPVVIMNWTVREQIFAASYVAIGLGLLVCFSLPILRSNREQPRFLPAKQSATELLSSR